jgi:hypothetical protein
VCGAARDELRGVRSRHRQPLRVLAIGGRGDQQQRPRAHLGDCPPGRAREARPALRLRRPRHGPRRSSVLPVPVRTDHPHLRAEGLHPAHRPGRHRLDQLRRALSQLLQKLAVLVPAPRPHLLRYHGVLAPRAACRSLIVPRPVEARSAQASAAVTGNLGAVLAAAGLARPARPDWAALLRRVFAVDVLHGLRRGGRRRLRARPLAARSCTIATAPRPRSVGPCR